MRCHATPARRWGHPACASVRPRWQPAASVIQNSRRLPTSLHTHCRGRMSRRCAPEWKLSLRRFRSTRAWRSNPMAALTLDGSATATAVKRELAIRIESLRGRGITPGLGTLLVGEDPGSRSYVAGKHRDCAEVGIASIRVDLPSTASVADVRAALRDLNAAPEVTGYIVQLPLPAGLCERDMLELIDPDKDADGLHPTNLGRLVLSVAGDLASPLPCTPAGIVELLRRYDVPLVGRRVVVIGRGITVGRPLGLLLTRKGLDATVTLTHSRTTDLADEVRHADIVVAAVPMPHLITPRAPPPPPPRAARGGGGGHADLLVPAVGVPPPFTPDWVKPGATVLDVGI